MCVIMYHHVCHHSILLTPINILNFRLFLVFVKFFFKKDGIFSGSEIESIFNTIKYEINTFNLFFLKTTCLVKIQTHIRRKRKVDTSFEADGNENR